MSSMTRKHFQALADLVDYARNEDMFADAETAKDFANDLADLCRGFNNNFNRERFLEACGVQD
jgi:hypothetical protein